VGLAAHGDDGRYVDVGGVRALRGKLAISALLEAGISEVRDLEGSLVSEGIVRAKNLRPARRGGKPVLYVQRRGKYWRGVKVNGKQEGRFAKARRKCPLLRLIFGHQPFQE
jgi:hypothetical protein